MIQLLIDWSESRRDIGKVHHPARIRSDRASNSNPDYKRMSVQAGAFMQRRYLGQAMRRFESKFLENFHELARVHKQGLN